MKGKVKKFDKEKGFGFIQSEETKDVFFHYSALNVDGYKTAEAGDEVEFEFEETDKGPRATSVTIIR